MRLLLLTLGASALAIAQPLNGTRPLDVQGDPAAQMVEGIARYLVRQTNEAIPRRAPSRQRLRKILGVVDKRVPFATPDVVATTSQSALLAETATFRVYAVRWPVLDGIT